MFTSSTRNAGTLPRWTVTRDASARATEFATSPLALVQIAVRTRTRSAIPAPSSRPPTARQDDCQRKIAAVEETTHLSVMNMVRVRGLRVHLAIGKLGVLLGGECTWRRALGRAVPPPRSGANRLQTVRTVSIDAMRSHAAVCVSSNALAASEADVGVARRHVHASNVRNLCRLQERQMDANE